MMLNRLNYYLILLSTLTFLAGCTNLVIPAFEEKNTSTVAVSNNTEINESFSYNDYRDVLKQYVNENGFVNYEKLKDNRQQLDQFNAAIGQVSPETYQNWTDTQKLAFLINAYNAFTLQSIIDQTPLPSSIRDIPGVWKWRKFTVAGEEKTLDNIEHDTIRKEFNEPRIHVALVCAAISCPPLRNEPYTAEKLDQQLDDQVNRFIDSPHGIRIAPEEATIYLSSIFQWYGQDWIKSYGIKEQFNGNESERAILNFLSNYLPSLRQKYLSNGNYKIKYLDYDWSLNQQ